MKAIVFVTMMSLMTLISGCQQEKRPALASEINDAADAYAKDIRNAIEQRLYLKPEFRGKQCYLHIAMMPDGRVTEARVETGYPELCYAALAAVATSALPRPPGDDVYQRFKRFNIDVAIPKE